MSNIRQTIATVVPRGYETYVNRAAEALEAREARIADTLIEFAKGKGLSDAEARQAITRAGLVATPARVNVADAEIQRLTAEAAALSRRIDALRTSR